MSDNPAVSTDNRILLTVNGKAIVMVTPTGQALVAKGETLDSASEAFWNCVAQRGRGMYVHRRLAVSIIVGEMRAFAESAGGSLGAKFEAWAERLIEAVED